MFVITAPTQREKLIIQQSSLSEFSQVIHNISNKFYAFILIKS